MQALTDDKLNDLLADHEPPCVSVYLPTSRTYPESQQNAILYRNLLREAEEALRQTYPAAARALLERFADVANDAPFWTHRKDGLAVFGSPDTFQVFDVRPPVRQRVVVGESFHVKPLLRQARTADRYQVLCLTRNRVWMFEGDRHGLDEIDLNGVPATVEEALGEEVGAPQNREHYRGSHGGAFGGAVGGTSPGSREPGPRPAAGKGPPGGHNAKGDDAKLDAERFFRVIDAAVLDRHTRPSALPLILVALPENQALFRSVSRNDMLMRVGVENDPDKFGPNELRAAVWQAFAPSHRERLARHVEDFQVAKARGQGSDDLAEVARAAHDGRVGILLLDADRRQPGNLDPNDGTPRPADGRPDADDLFDDLGELALRRKGMVLVVPSDVIPSKTGVAAIYRY